MTSNSQPIIFNELQLILNPYTLISSTLSSYNFSTSLKLYDNSYHFAFFNTSAVEISHFGVKTTIHYYDQARETSDGERCFIIRTCDEAYRTKGYNGYDQGIILPKPTYIELLSNLDDSLKFKAYQSALDELKLSDKLFAYEPKTADQLFSVLLIHDVKTAELTSILPLATHMFYQADLDIGANHFNHFSDYQIQNSGEAQFLDLSQEYA
jgi:hypothetical protein